MPRKWKCTGRRALLKWLQYAALSQGGSCAREQRSRLITHTEPSTFRLATDVSPEWSLASRDVLTGVANRLFFDHHLGERLGELASGQVQRVTVLFLDLDRFKAVNDTLGHPVGDALLCKVAERLQSLMPENGALARLGGDEFAMVLTDLEREPTATLAAKIIELVQRTYLIEGQVVHIGVSIGIANAPEDTSARSQLLKYADLALYHSKASGRCVFHFFTPDLAARAQERRQMELGLRRALVLRQFEIHYQPQIDVESGSILVMEGLLYWRNPERGLIAAKEFLPVAEEIGFSLAIGEWMLKTACKEAARWPGEVKVALNISAMDFEAAKFPVAVGAALKAAGLPGSRLEIEVTEDVLLRNGLQVKETLEQLRRLDVRVAMDSFGTGFASLSQLVNFPFDTIKIDSSLSGLRMNDAKSRAIVQAISALGRTLGIATLVEGIATSNHLDAVRADGCQTLQGFYCGKMHTVADLPTLFASPE